MDMDDETVTVDELIEEMPEPVVKRRPGRPRKHHVPLPQDVTVTGTIEETAEPKQKRQYTKRAKKVTAEDIASAVEMSTNLYAVSTGKVWWGYTKEEAIQWTPPIAELLNKLPAKWISNSSMGVSIAFAAMAFWRQTQPRIAQERHYAMQLRHNEHNAVSSNGASETPQPQPTVTPWGTEV